MIKIAICDDEKIYADLIAKFLMKSVNDSFIDVTVDTYTNPKELSSILKKTAFDVLFLDIDMPDISGFDISEELRRRYDNKTLIIYISAKRDLVFQSFEYSPFYFICKTDYTNLKNEIEHVADKLIKAFQQERKVIIKDTANGEVVINLKDILYIKSERHYISYQLINRVEPYTERSTIADKINELASPELIRPHLRYLVNMSHIRQYGTSTNKIIMDNGESVPISRSFAKSALNSYMIYKRR